MPHIIQKCRARTLFFLFAIGAYVALKNKLDQNKWLLTLTMWSIPLPFVAAEFGWITAEAGRQPWTVFGYLPTLFRLRHIPWDIWYFLSLVLRCFIRPLSVPNFILCLSSHVWVHNRMTTMVQRTLHMHLLLLHTKGGHHYGPLYSS